MYERFYGLKEKPFNLTPDPDFLYLAEQHRRAMEQVLYGIRRREGFTVLVGDVGTGKTTLCWALLARLEQNVRSSLVLNPLLGEEDMLRAIIHDFGVEPRLGGRSPRAAAPGVAYDPTWMNGLSRKELVDELNAFLLDGAETDEFCVVIIDEAQDLSIGVLEQLRLLSNLETAKKKLLQIIFVGQLEFEDKLNHPKVRSLNQRISIRHRIEPLARADVQRYIEHRLKVAGASPRLVFTPSAVRMVCRYTKGYPRLVNLVCDRALLASSSERQYQVGPRFVKKAARALRGSGLAGRFGFPLKRIALAAATILILAMIIAGFSASRGSLRLGWGGDDRSSEDVAADTAAATGEPAPTPAAATVPPVTTPAPPSAAAAASAPPPPAPVDSSPTSAPGPSTPSVPETDSRQTFVVQVHSLSSAEESEKAAASLQERGYSAFSRQVGRWHTVYVGPFDSYEAAAEARRNVRVLSPHGAIIRRSSN
jgi:general secretion pathway protein A